MLSSLQQSYGLSASDAKAVLAFRRRAERSSTIQRLLQVLPLPEHHPHTLCHLAILCLETLTLRQAARLDEEQHQELRRAAIAALHGQIGALATEQLCQQLHRAVHRREQLSRSLTPA